MTFLNINCLIDNTAQPHSAFWGEHAYSHPDHTGGLSAFLERRPRLPVYAHPDLFRERFSRRESHLKPKGCH